MPDSSRPFRSSSRESRQRSPLWRTLVWWALAAVAAFVLLESVPSHAASGPVVVLETAMVGATTNNAEAIRGHAMGAVAMVAEAPSANQKR